MMAKQKGSEFQSGDIVRLKSGGPNMTVRHLDSFGNYFCQWFSGSKLQSGNFDPGSLEIAPEPEE